MRLVPVVALALAASACAAETDERPAEFAYIVKAILAPSCATATCHSARTQREGVDLSSVAAAQDTFDRIPLAPQTGELRNSQLLFVLGALAGEDPGELRMPVDGPLPDADIALIEQWIIAGAPR